MLKSNSGRVGDSILTNKVGGILKLSPQTAGTITTVKHLCQPKAQKERKRVSKLKNNECRKQVIWTMMDIQATELFSQLWNVPIPHTWLG